MESEEEQRRKRLEFRKMLLKVSEGLTSENVADLKHLLRGDIVQSKLEGSSRGIDIFELLIEKNSISSDNIGYLKDCLDFLDRKDLIADLVKPYEERGSITRMTRHKIRDDLDLNTVVLTEIGKEVGKDWKMLARHLSVPEPDIEQINNQYFRDLHEASYQALVRWKDKKGDRATAKVLKRALEDMRLMGVVSKYFDV
ncbi:PREDICTED: FAS-associated death domain protein-like [Amphimedon queenslandica]|uniref:Death domain-containing protein n=1 Tax=Amphimedon queenslandica TaxID=400682 RepID=A0A1X7UHE5_AMPQE|nr:PREDICTED: FAS-associated death domain protein-like [Amphimedon queenslandica]|eukprot:XP_003387950.1 PREDICTED: FAS-associated death domain protein-like [Amphimedon queenslandica]